MRIALLLVLLLAPAGGTQDDPALVVEWEIKWIGRDTLQRKREIHRRERLTIYPDRMRIDDLTFGKSWVIRADKKTVWIIDTMQERYSELTFEQIKKRQDEIAKELTEAAAHVPGTEDERQILRILEGMGRYRKAPNVEVRKTGEAEEILGQKSSEHALVINNEIHFLTTFIDTRHEEGAAYFDLLSKVGAFHPAVAEKLRALGGFPVEGVIRYLSFGERVTARVRTISMEKKDVGAEVFSIPRKFQRIPLAGFEKAPERVVEKPKDLRSSFDEDELERKRRALKQDEDDGKKDKDKDKKKDKP